MVILILELCIFLSQDIFTILGGKYFRSRCSWENVRCVGDLFFNFLGKSVVEGLEICEYKQWHLSLENHSNHSVQENSFVF